ncbi:MAG: hypothetical protein HN813_01215 [Rhodospirillaceae bacterium]|jgi:hypothetical protein|nr:hypothetical protein [Rhodospirillaceae bacterium]MBT7360575.1 hypothetical protein [Rhodospirillaceae bacterium]
MSAVATTAKDETTRPVLMDLTVLGDADPRQALNDLMWPSPYDAYHKLSRTFIDSLMVTIHALDPGPDPAAVIRAKTYDIVTDLAFVARLAFDIANARKAGRALLYDVDVCPMLAFLETGGDPARSPVPRIWHHPVDLRVKTRARKAARRGRSHLQARLAGGERIDVHNRNNLVNTVLGVDTRAAIDWPVTNIDWHHGRDVPAALTESVSEMGDAYARVIAQFIDDAALRDTLEALGRHLISYHLAKSWADFKTFEQHMRLRPMGTMLISGTPKHLGRLAGWLYRREGLPVVRCAHGGERVFFSDYEWGLAEFPDCDTYYAHSAGERDALAHRLSTNATALVQPGQPIEFRTLGSPHHQGLLTRSHARRRPKNTGTIIYVAGGYLGEQLGDFPNRKPPDPLYLDWQIDLVLAIKALGYRVVVKPHPAGIAHEARFLAHHTDSELEGLFDPTNVSADAFVFDFAGTAFFDALATDIPMVFADMGVRPYDPTAYDDLVTRCPIAPAARDDRGRFRIDRDQLGNALTNAIEMNTCPAGFHDRYFGA